VRRRLLRLPALGAAGALAAALLAAGCAPAPHRTAIPVASPLAAAQAPLGAWRVVGHYAVGVTAMTTAEANRWLGREARYSRAAAGFAPDTCLGPTYVTHTFTLSELAADYHVRPEDLKITATHVQVVDVRCGPGWSGPGNRLIVLGANRLLTSWDGMMLELARE
jgi:hypothetical protein